MSQKDTDAPWTKKNGQSSFGYKNHIDTDVEYAFIRRYQVTDASVHDSQVLWALLDAQNQGEEVWADSAYRSESIEWILQILEFGVAESGDDFTKFSRISQWFQTLIHRALMQRHYCLWFTTENHMICIYA